MQINKNIIFFILEYTLIADSGRLDHVAIDEETGYHKSAFKCWREDISSKLWCELMCTWTNCIAYSYNIKEEKDCYMYPSERSCLEDGWTQEPGPPISDRPLATSMSDLYVVPTEGYVSYEAGKILYGKKGMQDS